MLIHGYGDNGRSDFNRDLKNALLSHDDYNVIVGNDLIFIDKASLLIRQDQLTGRQHLVQAIHQQLRKSSDQQFQ